MQEISREKEWLDTFEAVRKRFDDVSVLIELGEESGDATLEAEVAGELATVVGGIEKLELQNMLSGEDDVLNAILTIHPGAGGTEAQDWGEMLLRMYLRWADRRGYATSIVDRLDGDGAGIKSVTVEITGKFAYGYLKAENGVHRLVRISPFDSNARRHTSFASVFVVSRNRR